MIRRERLTNPLEGVRPNVASGVRSTGGYPLARPQKFNPPTQTGARQLAEALLASGQGSAELLSFVQKEKDKEAIQASEAYFIENPQALEDYLTSTGEKLEAQKRDLNQKERRGEISFFQNPVNAEAAEKISGSLLWTRYGLPALEARSAEVMSPETSASPQDVAAQVIADLKKQYPKVEESDRIQSAFLNAAGKDLEKWITRTSIGREHNEKEHRLNLAAENVSSRLGSLFDLSYPESTSAVMADVQKELGNYNIEGLPASHEATFRIINQAVQELALSDPERALMVFDSAMETITPPGKKLTLIEDSRLSPTIQRVRNQLGDASVKMEARQDRDRVANYENGKRLISNLLAVKDSGDVELLAQKASAVLSADDVTALKEDPEKLESLLRSHILHTDGMSDVSGDLDVYLSSQIQLRERLSEIRTSPQSLDNALQQAKTIQLGSEEEIEDYLNGAEGIGFGPGRDKLRETLRENMEGRFIFNDRSGVVGFRQSDRVLYSQLTSLFPLDDPKSAKVIDRFYDKWTRGVEQLSYSLQLEEDRDVKARSGLSELKASVFEEASQYLDNQLKTEELASEEGPSSTERLQQLLKVEDDFFSFNPDDKAIDSVQSFLEDTANQSKKAEAVFNSREALTFLESRLARMEAQKQQFTESPWFNKQGRNWKDEDFEAVKSRKAALRAFVGYNWQEALESEDAINWFTTPVFESEEELADFLQENAKGNNPKVNELFEKLSLNSDEESFNRFAKAQRLLIKQRR